MIEIMSGTLNHDARSYSTNFKDCNCSVTIKKVENFVSLMNLEEVCFGKSTPHADLALIYRSKKNKVIIFEMKGVNASLKDNQLKQLINRIKGKLQPTIDLFLGKKIEEGKLGLNNLLNLGLNVEFEYVLVFKNEDIIKPFLSNLTTRILQVNIGSSTVNVPLKVILEKGEYFPK
ncbi:MAG: hypothetical protein B2I18_03995 [Cuniculiplasma sp. C_DKE]|nr:MAG: hypothetical protein B2I18_03995 [Cuniculiplasma sp. C_DKE]